MMQASPLGQRFKIYQKPGCGQESCLVCYELLGLRGENLLLTHNRAAHDLETNPSHVLAFQNAAQS